MSDSKQDFPIGQCLAKVRDAAGMSQAQLAQAVTFSTATVSRIESGEKPVSDDELEAMLKAINTPKANALAEFIKQDWDQIDRPAFDHPNRASLWQANLTLRRLAELRKDTELKAVFLRQVDLYEEELRRIAEYLASVDHYIAYIGSIGVGKSTAICKQTGLLKPGEEKLDRQIVLETGAGGITLCEVHLSQGPRYGIRIVPRTEDSIRQDVEDFCEYLMASTKAAAPSPTQSDDDEDGDPLGISKEVVRAIRNMSDLTEKRKEKKGKRIRIDPAKELAKQFNSAQELCIHVLTKMDLLRRNRRDLWYPEGSTVSPMHWMQDTFAAINNGRHPEITLPQKIEVIVPDPIFDSRELLLRIVDTKGVDQTAERQDLECHFDDPKALVVLCSRFNDAPEVALQTLLRRAREAGARDVAMKTVLLVLPRPEEALAVKYDDGTRVDDDEEGYDLKRDQIRLRLDQQGMGGVGIEFFNAREEGPKALRERLIERIVQLRQAHSDRIVRLSEAVERLDENRRDEQTRMVFEHVMSDMESWIKTNRTIELKDEGIEEPLVAAINGTRYASTVRAAVRRYGDWYNLDYYHHLGYSVRKLAVDQIGIRIDAFKVVVNNLIANDDLSPAKEFLEGIVARVDAALDDSYRRIQASGREAFKQTLAKDYAFWSKCEDRWGQGPGYRLAIRDMTDQEFDQEFLQEVKKLIVGLLDGEWSEIVKLMESLLQERDLATAAA
jgi:transcriptional regulator with XRE-family HTH domain